MKALDFIYDYLRNREQRTKTDYSYSSWKIILYGVPQGSVLEPYIWYRFVQFISHNESWKYCQLCRWKYALVSRKNIDKVIRLLKESSRVFFNWFSDNQFQANASQFRVPLSTDQHMQVYISVEQIENSSSEKLLGVTIDVKHVLRNIRQVYVKALARNVPFMNTQKKKVLVKAFFMA